MTDRLRKIAQISARVFNEVVRPPGVRSPTKYMRRPMLGKAIQNWYPQDSRNDPKVIRGLHLAGVYTDENLQYKEWRRDYMIARGKPPVQKGQGRRAAKRK